MLLLDVLPISIGIKTSDGYFCPIILKNTQIPVEVTESFYTDKDNQRSITLEIYEGESDLIENDHFIAIKRFPITDWKKKSEDQCVYIIIIYCL